MQQHILHKKNSLTKAKEFSTKIDSGWTQVKQIKYLENYLNLCQEFIVILVKHRFNISLVIDL